MMNMEKPSPQKRGRRQNVPVTGRVLIFVSTLGMGLRCNNRAIAFVNKPNCIGKNIHVGNNVKSRWESFSSLTIRHNNKRSVKLSQKLDSSGNPDKGSFEEGESSASSSPYWIPPDQLELLKETVDIVSAVESYGLPQFQRKGDNKAVAVCPFHNDRNPSLSIDGNRGLYKCFSCGAGGDVFNFVREYSVIRGGEDAKLSYGQALRHVAKEFGDPNRISMHAFDSPTVKGGLKNRLSEEEQKKLHAKKQRLLLANAAAAAFYGRCLMTLPSAGTARSHLIDRGISPATVRIFAMGYAPDAYFEFPRSQWGNGSLVNQLRELGFTSKEMLDAGLVTRTKKGKAWEDIVDTSDLINERNSSDTSQNATKTIDDDFSTLMDRFRGRLMVPIFDSNGKSVLGFGGRILPSTNTGNGSFKPPKYINSPESLVFKKSSILFGQHHAREAVKEAKVELSSKSDVTNKRPSGGTIVVVEGYLDAIALSEVGVSEVVACMGTALTTEQLTSAARTAGTRGGRIVLCLDGDEAGINAVERVCSSKALLSTSETCVVDIVVATLPDGIKDPAEFIESKGGKGAAGEAFQREVLDSAKEWTVWFLERLMIKYDAKSLRGTAGSFSDICERVSEFLSTFPNPADRTKRAFQAAGVLAIIISKESGGSGSSSNALQIQLESDLVSMTSRKAAARESVERRIESVDGFSSDGIKEKLAKMARGEGFSGDDNGSKLSAKALKAAQRANPEIAFRKQLPSKDIYMNETVTFRGGKQQAGVDYAKRGTRGRTKRSGKTLSAPILTSHFSGFEFENQSDMDWLGIESKKKNQKDLTFGTSAEFMMSEKHVQHLLDRGGTERVPMSTSNDIVYFNSNAYHGDQLLTQEGLDTGYTNHGVTRDISVFEKGVGTLVTQNCNSLQVAAEINLLRTLVEYKPARSAMKAVMDTSDATGSETSIDWSRPERLWLFECLTVSSSEIPIEVFDSGSVQQLWEYLAKREDAPMGAFGDPTAIFLYLQEEKKDSVAVDTNNISLEDDVNNGFVDAVVESMNVELGNDKKFENTNIATEMNEVPSDIEDIEDWSASMDPSLFDEDFDDFDEETSLDKVLSVDAENLSNNRDEEMYEASRPAGTLDIFFTASEDIFAETYDNSIPRELRSELVVQEALASLLKASAMRHLSSVKSQWISASTILDSRILEELNATTSNGQNNTRIENSFAELESMQLDELRDHCQALVSRVRESSQRVHDLTLSAKRITSRLMDYSGADGVEGKLSIQQQEELAKDLDDHMSNLPEETWRPKSPGFNETYSFGSDAFDDDIDSKFGGSRETNNGLASDSGMNEEQALENEITRIDSEWGDWAVDGFHWAPEDMLKGERTYAVPTRGKIREAMPLSEIPSVDEGDFSDEEGIAEEELDDTIARIDEEWGKWA